MKYNYLLSILIPVYNASRYLKRCIESIVSQAEFTHDIELILIDDGSKDDSLSVLNDYAILYNNIKVITRDNRGVGPTRNELIQNASGIYFWFIDADDFIANDSFAHIIPLLRSLKYDMLLMSYFWDDGRLCKEVKYEGEFSSALEMTDRFILNNSLWTRIYRTSLVRENNIVFQSYIMGEDFDFIMKLTPLIGFTKCIDKPLYNYIFNSSSAVGSIAPKHRLKVSEDSIRCIENNVKFIKELPAEHQLVLKKHLDIFIFGYLHSLYCAKLNLKTKLNAVSELRKCGALPIATEKQNLKHKIFVYVINNRALGNISMALNALLMKIRPSNK